MTEIKQVILNESNLSFNIRWWAWGLTSFIIGIAMGYIIWGVR